VSASTSDEVKAKPYTRPRNTGIKFSNGHVIDERAPKEDTASMAAAKKLFAETAAGPRPGSETSGRSLVERHGLRLTWLNGHIVKDAGCEVEPSGTVPLKWPKGGKKEYPRQTKEIKEAPEGTSAETRNKVGRGFGRTASGNFVSFEKQQNALDNGSFYRRIVHSTDPLEAFEVHRRSVTRTPFGSFYNRVQEKVRMTSKKVTSYDGFAADASARPSLKKKLKSALEASPMGDYAWMGDYADVPLDQPLPEFDPNADTQRGGGMGKAPKEEKKKARRPNTSKSRSKKKEKECIEATVWPSIIIEDEKYKRPYLNILYTDDPDFDSKNWEKKFRTNKLIRNTNWKPLC